MEEPFSRIEEALRSLENTFTHIEEVFRSLENTFARIEEAFRCIEKTFTHIKEISGTSKRLSHPSMLPKASSKTLSGASLRRLAAPWVRHPASEQAGQVEEDLQQHEHGTSLPVEFRAFTPLFGNPGEETHKQGNRNRSREQGEPQHRSKDLSR
jgi:hypothetical protein